MRTKVTTEEIEHYREHGFVVIEDLLDANELETWRRAIGQAVERRLAISGHSTHLHAAWQDRTSGPGSAKVREFLDFYERVFVQQVNLWTTDDAARHLVIDERLGRFAADLAGTRGIRLYHDQALFKPPWGNPTAFHLDVPYWSFTTPDALSLWIALDDVTLQNGCLYFVPGSHKQQILDNSPIDQHIGSLFEKRPEWGQADPVPCTMRAGSASFHNGLTAHGAGANMTSRPRRAMSLQLMPDDARYNGTINVLPAEYAAKLAIGDPLDDDSINPLLWHRTPPAEP